jgi:hypothetical protein
LTTSTHRYAAQVERGAEVVVLEIPTATDEIVGVVAERRMFAVVQFGFEIVEAVSANVGSEIAPLQRQFSGRADAVGDDAFVVVEIAVVHVDSGRIPAISDADEFAIATLRTGQKSVGETDVEESVDLAKVKYLSPGRCGQQAHDQHRQDRRKASAWSHRIPPLARVDDV